MVVHDSDNIAPGAKLDSGIDDVSFRERNKCFRIAALDGPDSIVIFPIA